MHNMETTKLQYRCASESASPKGKFRQNIYYGEPKKVTFPD